MRRHKNLLLGQPQWQWCFSWSYWRPKPHQQSREYPEKPFWRLSSVQRSENCSFLRTHTHTKYMDTHHSPKRSEYKGGWHAFIFLAAKVFDINPLNCMLFCCFYLLSYKIFFKAFVTTIVLLIPSCLCDEAFRYNVAMDVNTLQQDSPKRLYCICLLVNLHRESQTTLATTSYCKQLVLLCITFIKCFGQVLVKWKLRLFCTRRAGLSVCLQVDPSGTGTAGAFWSRNQEAEVATVSIIHCTRVMHYIRRHIKTPCLSTILVSRSV